MLSGRMKTSRLTAFSSCSLVEDFSQRVLVVVVKWRINDPGCPAEYLGWKQQAWFVSKD